MKGTLTLLAALSLGCGSDRISDRFPKDAGFDVRWDMRRDIGIGVSNDVGIDAPRDQGVDARSRADVPRPADAAAAVVTLADIEEQVFRPHCAIPSCHASAEPTGRMRLDEDFPRTTLRDVGAMGVSCRDQALVRIVPGDPAGSLLYRKITEDAPPCGSRMPQAADPLPPALIALVRDWIAAGAP